MPGNVKRWLVWTLILGVLIVCATVAAWDFLTREYSRVGSFDLSPDTTINVYVQTSWEVSIPYSYEIVRNGEVIAARTDFLYGDPDNGRLEFRAVTAKGGDLIGLVSTDHPTVWLMAHELSSGKLLFATWGGGEVGGEGLLEELRSDPPGGE